MNDLSASALHVVAKPQNKDRKSYDIIAVHGLGGEYNRTWTSDTSFNLLTQSLARSFPSCMILSYDCPTLLQDLRPGSDGADQFVSHLLDHRRRTGRSKIPIIFIAHSFGGILVKQVFVSTHPSRTSLSSQREFHDSIYGFVFLGTPHKHHDPPNIAALWRVFEFKCEETLNGNIDDLRTVFETTSRANDEYFRYGGEDIPTVCFYETKPTWVGLQEVLIVPQNRAMLRSRPTDGGGLATSHFDLPKFEGLGDQNHTKLVHSFETLMEIVSDSGFRAIETDRTKLDGIRVLSLDGGGVKGLFTVLILRSIIQEAQRIDKSSIRKRPCDYFDLIGGTSTGGLLAIMLGRLQMDVQSCIDTYRRLSIGIFQRNDWIPFKKFAEAALGQPWFSGQRLRDAICQTVDEQISQHERDGVGAAGLTAKDVRLLSIEQQRTRCFVCAVPEGQHEADIIRSYHPYPRRGRDTSSYKIWEAARATSAAPMYFPAIEVQGTTYFDGGLACNNPVLNVIDEAKAEFPGAPISVIVSIGTGKVKWVDPHGLSVISSVLNRATGTEHQHDQIMTRPEFDNLRGGYFRFQEIDGLGEIDLADATKLDAIEVLAQEYLSKSSVRRMIINCAQRLVGE